MSERINQLTFNVWVKAQAAKQEAKNRIDTFFKEEKGGPSDLVIPIIIIVILIALAFIFKDRLGQLINKIFDSADTAAGDTGELGSH